MLYFNTIWEKKYYDDKLQFSHYIPYKRLNIKYLKKINRASSYSNVLLRGYNAILNGKNNNNYKESWSWNLFIHTYILFRYDLLKYIINFENEVKKLEAIINIERKIGKIKGLLYNRKKLENSIKEIKEAKWNSFKRIDNKLIQKTK